MWFAKPSSQWTCTLYFLPVFTGAHLETAVERARVCGLVAGWQGALSCQCALRAGAGKEEQGLGRRLLAA